jgi:hypothetical protein
MSHLPVACTLDPAALKARREGLLSELLRRAVEHEELADGHRLRFEATDDTLAAIAQTVAAERHCCRFLRFHITVEPDGGPITLELSGPPGTREFVAALLDVHTPTTTCDRSLSDAPASS